MRPTKRFDPLLGGVGGDAAVRLAVAAVWLETGMPILVSFIWLRMFSLRWLRALAWGGAPRCDSGGKSVSVSTSLEVTRLSESFGRSMGVRERVVGNVR